MKEEVVKEVQNLKKSDPKAIAAIVDHVEKKYQEARGASAADLKRAAKELKANWKMLEAETKRAMRARASRAK
jgi:hypothetical protein